MDYTEIQKDFNKVIAYSQEFNDINTNKLFEKWYEAKKDLIKRLGGLIYETPEPVTLTLGEGSKEERRHKFISWVQTDVEPLLADFLVYNEKGFFDNKTCYDYEMPDGTIIPAGIKIGRAFKFFTEVDPNKLEEVRQEMSRVLQDNKVTGILCVSVHPLDFLSLSENNHKWRSCHALNGEYRAGNLSYMMDKCTVIVYLRSEGEKVILPRFPDDVPWNNKKWRCLFFLDDIHKMIWAGRQYPFFVENALYIVQQMIFNHFKYFDILPKFLGCCDDSDYSWRHCLPKGYNTISNQEIYLVSPHLPVNGYLMPVNKLVRDAEYSMHFNDLISSSSYAPYVLMGSHYDFDSINFAHPFEVGGLILCTMCGEHSVANSEVMVCEECLVNKLSILNETVGVCYGCGERTILDENHYINGHYYCNECFDELPVCCDCHEILEPGDEFHTDDGIFCQSCWESWQESKSELRYRSNYYDD